MDLINYFENNANLPEELVEVMDGLFLRKEYSKKHRLLDMDNRSHKVFFIEKGLGRTYYIKEDKDITHLFFKEGSFNLPVESIFYNKPSPYAFELLEDSLIRVADYRQIKAHLEANLSSLKFVQSVLIDVVMLFSERLYSIQFQSAHERYEHMMKQYPGILLRAPLGHIASYLGMTQQRLSVIRANFHLPK